MKKPGRKRLEVCSAGHEMTDQNRLWKHYLRADGSVSLIANGCRLCNLAMSAEYRAKHAERIKAKRCGLEFRSEEAESDN